MHVQQAYAKWATSYDDDRNLTRDLDQTVTQEVLGSRRFRSILEFGCGTGKNTALFARIGGQVRALDFSEEMIAKARDKFSAEHVTFELADITKSWPAPGQSVDLVACNLILEHIEDLSFVFAEAARVLAGGGRFFVSELHPFRQYQGVVAHFVRNEELTEVPAFLHHLSDFLAAAAASELTLEQIKESWHVQDEKKAPRLLSFLFKKPG